MRNQACMSNVRDPQSRSRKRCVCGGHQGRRGKRARKRWSRSKFGDVIALDSKRYAPYWRLDLGDWG